MYNNRVSDKRGGAGLPPAIRTTPPHPPLNQKRAHPLAPLLEPFQKNPDLAVEKLVTYFAKITLEFFKKRQKFFSKYFSCFCLKVLF